MARIERETQTASGIVIPAGADAPDAGLRAVRAAVEGAPPVLRRPIAGAAVAELHHREKQLRRKAARLARKSRKASRAKKRR